MKKTILILAMVLCLALAFTSCKTAEPDSETPPENTVVVDSPEVAADKAAIIKVVSGLKLGDAFAEVGDVAIPDVEEVVADVESMMAQANVSISNGQEHLAVIYNGGLYVYTGYNGSDLELNEAFLLVDDVIYSVTEGAVYGIGLEMLGSTDVVDTSMIDAYKEQIEYYVDLFDGVTIPSLTSSLITKEGDWYMLNPAFMRDVFKSYIISYATDMGEEITDEAIAELDESLESITINLGFAVSGENIRGIKASVSFVSEYVDYPDGYGAASVEKTETIKYSFEALLTEDLTALDRVAGGMSDGTESVYVALDVDMTAEEIKAVDIGLDYAAGGETGNAKATVNFENFAKANADVVSINMNLTDEDNEKMYIVATLKNDADANGVIDVKVDYNGEEFGAIVGGVDYDNSNAPENRELFLSLIENFDAYDAKGQEIFEAYYNAYYEGLDHPTDAYVAYYDAELDVTIVTVMYLDGYYDVLVNDEMPDDEEYVFVPSLEESSYTGEYVFGINSPDGGNEGGTEVDPDVDVNVDEPAPEDNVGENEV